LFLLPGDFQFENTRAMPMLGLMNIHHCWRVPLLIISTGAIASAATFTNSLGMKMIEVHPGSYLRGSETGDYDEKPAHPVRISKAFHMSATEVTNAQYEEFEPAHRELRGAMGFSKEDDEAVVFVSWRDAMRFCQWLSEKEGKPYRLPTEAEWEYACRAGTTTPYHTGENLPEEYHKHQKEEWEPVPVDLRVGRTPANAWGFHDMHGNVEEWCLDWYGPYPEGEQTDPVGLREGNFKITRGGSHNTPVEYLRSANRLGTLPEDKHWLIGFRVVMGEMPSTTPLPSPEPELWAQNVDQTPHDWPAHDAETPFFAGPVEFVKIPPGSEGPLFSRHNHQPAITACPNGDLLAIWYSCRREAGRELAVVASRLRQGETEWEPASLFWNTPDRNDHGNALWWDGKKTIYHFNGLGTDGTWAKLALIMRASTDNGATWSKARLINPQHGLRNQVIAGVFQTRDGEIILPCDAVPGGHGGTAIHIGRNEGRDWEDPGANAPTPEFEQGKTGGWIAGIHAGVVELKDGRLLALGRGDSINGEMPKSISSDKGRTWTYSASGLPPIGSGQRVVLTRLAEGPLFLVSFAGELLSTNAAGEEVKVSGMFGALSHDEGETWPVKRLITDGGLPRELDGGGNTRKFILSATTAEPRGYLDAIQTPDGIIHLISSKQHYQFNLAWLNTPLPIAQTTAQEQTPPSAPQEPEMELTPLEKQFQEALRGRELVGRWRLIENGQLGEEREEKYQIENVVKAKDDFWVVYARIQYGARDVVAPVPVQVKWAGDTPVITMDDLAIPGLGRYSARVLIHDGAYSGAWSGPNARGFLQGTIK
jgi:formylglycine-generating enzyme